MLSVYSVKPGFQRLLQPVVGRMARRGICPNSVTLAAFVTSCAGGLCILLWPDAAWPLLLLPGVLFLRMSLNAARATPPFAMLASFVLQLGKRFSCGSGGVGDGA